MKYKKSKPFLISPNASLYLFILLLVLTPNQAFGIDWHSCFHWKNNADMENHNIDLRGGEGLKEWSEDIEANNESSPVVRDQPYYYQLEFNRDELPDRTPNSSVDIPETHTGKLEDLGTLIHPIEQVSLTLWDSSLGGVVASFDDLEVNNWFPFDPDPFIPRNWGQVISNARSKGKGVGWKGGSVAMIGEVIHSMGPIKWWSPSSNSLIHEMKVKIDDWKTGRYEAYQWDLAEEFEVYEYKEEDVVNPDTGEVVGKEWKRLDTTQTKNVTHKFYSAQDFKSAVFSTEYKKNDLPGPNSKEIKAGSNKWGGNPEDLPLNAKVHLFYNPLNLQSRGGADPFHVAWFKIVDKTPPQINAKGPGEGGPATVRRLKTDNAETLLPPLWSTGLAGFATSGDENLASELYFWDNLTETDQPGQITWNVSAYATAGLDGPTLGELTQIASGVINNPGPSQFIHTAGPVAGKINYFVNAKDSSGNTNPGSAAVKEDLYPAYNISGVAPDFAGTAPSFGFLTILDNDWPNILIEITSDKDPENPYYFPPIFPDDPAKPFPARLSDVDLRRTSEGHTGPGTLINRNDGKSDYIATYDSFLTPNPNISLSSGVEPNASTERVFFGNFRHYDPPPSGGFGAGFSLLDVANYTLPMENYSAADLCFEDYNVSDTVSKITGSAPALEYSIIRFDPYNLLDPISGLTPEARRKAYGFGSKFACVLRESGGGVWTDVSRTDPYALEEDVRYTFRFYAWDNVRYIFMGGNNGKDVKSGISAFEVKFFDPSSPFPKFKKAGGHTLKKLDNTSIDLFNPGLQSKQCAEFNYIFRSPNPQGGGGQGFDFDSALPWVEFSAQDFTPLLLKGGFYGPSFTNKTALLENINKRTLRVYLPIKDVKTEIRQILESKIRRK